MRQCPLLKVEKLPFGWKLLAPISYTSKITGATYIVPAGFVSDFASVPRLPFAFLLTGDSAHVSAVIHDYLLVYSIEPRRIADKIFLEAMRLEQVPAWRRCLMYLGVSFYTRWKEFWNG